MPFEPISRERIIEAARRLEPHVRRTPVLEVSGADFGLADCHLSFKLELTQYSGSFKVRGAFANLLILLLFVQLMFGALVAGLNAGLVANDWPTMGGDLIPAGLSIAGTPCGNGLGCSCSRCGIGNS